MDHKKIDLFIIRKKKEKVNYELELLDKIKIYSVFYILLLKLIDLRILITMKILLKFLYSNKYKIKQITGYNPRI